MPSLLPLLLGLLLGAATAEASCKAIKQQALARGGFIDAKYDCAPRLPPDLQHCTLHGLLTAYDGECGWLEGWGDKQAPRVYLRRTHAKALKIVPLEVLRTYALDLN